MMRKKKDIGVIMLEIQHVSKSFGTKKAVDDFSFTVKPGSPYGLLGRNGAGKTTTIKMILGLVEPDEGTIRYNGEAFNRSKHSLGYMPEERGLYLNARIDEQLVYFAKLEGKRHVQAEIDMWLERFELVDYKQKKAQELSKGNKQKVQLIATLLHDPEIIILDEPFSGLDPVNADLFTTIIQEQVQQAKTVIFSSHQMQQVEALCEDIAILKAGQIQVQGNLSTIQASYEKRFLQLPFTPAITEYLDSHFRYEQISPKELQVELENSQMAITVLQDLQAAGIDIPSFRCQQPSLHDIFVRVAK